MSGGDQRRALGMAVRSASFSATTVMSCETCCHAPTTSVTSRGFEVLPYRGGAERQAEVKARGASSAASPAEWDRCDGGIDVTSMTGAGRASDA